MKNKSIKMLKKMSIPNKITILRIILIPFIIILLLYPSRRANVVSLTLFIFACLTDKIDGALARKYGFVTRFGSFIDPLADKLLLNSVLVVLAIKGVLLWWLVILILVREILVQMLRIIAEANDRKVHASGGKIKGPAQMATIIAAMYFIIVSWGTYNWVLESWMQYTLSIMLIFTFFVAYSALIEFVIRNWDVYAEIFAGIKNKKS